MTFTDFWSTEGFVPIHQGRAPIVFNAAAPKVCEFSTEAGTSVRLRMPEKGDQCLTWDYNLVIFDKVVADNPNYWRVFRTARTVDKDDSAFYADKPTKYRYTLLESQGPDELVSIHCQFCAISAKKLLTKTKSVVQHQLQYMDKLVCKEKWRNVQLGILEED